MTGNLSRGQERAVGEFRHILNLGAGSGQGNRNPIIDNPSGTQRPPSPTLQPGGQTPTQPQTIQPEPSAANRDNVLQTENDNLRALVAKLQAQAQAPRAFIEDDEFDVIRSGNAAIREEEEKRHSIPDLVPGYRASPLTHGVSLKVIRAFKAFEYVPYIALTTATRIKADAGEQEMEIRLDGTLAVKIFDRSSEKAITSSAWQAASKLAVELARQYWPQGDIRAEALTRHHDYVTELGDSHSWPIALAYDIRQREIMHRDAKHDISVFNEAVVSLVSSQLMNESMASLRAQQAKPQTPSFKRMAPSDFVSASSPQKRARVERGWCFRCGFVGHMPADCRAEKTIAGRAAASLSPGVCKGSYSLESAEGRTFCFAFAKDSNCRFGDTCRNVHACSICGDKAHSAAACHQGQRS